jgi:hypothetical protein
MKRLLLAFLLTSPLALAEPRQVDEFHWTGVERIVAIGDLHGDYENYLAALRAADLIDRRGRWAGGEAHLVQSGDIPDRGPDTGKIIEHLDKLALEARRKGGHVHRLIGNHEAMNVYGDLRYVTPGEFEAFVDRTSEARRDRYFELIMQDLKARDPEAYAALPEHFRTEWDREHPLGWVEHRQAWDPRWNPDGEFARRTLDLQVAVQVNDLIFVHGGISGFYCQNSLESLTELIRGRLRNIDPMNTGPLEDEFGPLWYRGLSGESPEAAPETVQAILDRHGARHIVVGHTPTSGVIWPRYDGRVIQIDTGISSAYGGFVAYLEVNSDGLFAGYPGGKLALPPDDGERIGYLQQVIALNPDNPYLRERLADLQAPVPAVDPEPESAPAGVADGGESEGEAAASDEVQLSDEAQLPVPPTVPICGIYE